MDNQEYILGHRCVGATSFDYRGNARAAIRVSGSIIEISDERLTMIVTKLKEVAKETTEISKLPDNERKEFKQKLYQQLYDTFL